MEFENNSNVPVDPARLSREPSEIEKLLTYLMLCRSLAALRTAPLWQALVKFRKEVLPAARLPDKSNYAQPNVF